MAIELNDEAVFTAAVGYVFVAAADTAPPLPADITAFDPTGTFAWGTSIGHTARDELPEFGFDGGDSEVKGTWQKKNLRTVVSDVPVDHVIINLHQFDNAALGLYYGQENASTVNGVFAVKEAPTSTVKKALCLIIVDGSEKVAFCAPNVEIKREDSIELEVDEFAMLPVRATLVSSPTNKDLFQWIGEHINPAETP